MIERFVLASNEFSRRLTAVRAEQWDWPTPCAEWNVRQLVNHMAQGNFNYVRLLDGMTGPEFLRYRGIDAVGDDPLGAYRRSVRDCAEKFAQPGALRRMLDYPMGRLRADQA